MKASRVIAEFSASQCFGLVRLPAGIVLAVLLAACSPHASEEELLERARAALNNGEVRAAVIDVKTALQNNADSAPARRLYGEVYLFRQEPGPAAIEFERSLSAAEDTEVRVLYARALVAGNQDQRLLELHAEEQFASVDQDPRFLAALALAQASAGDGEAAQASILEALRAAPADPDVATAHARYLMYYTAGLEDARGRLQEIVTAHPDFAEAWSLLGETQLVNGELALAQSSYARASELNPFRLSDRLNLVSVLIEQDKLEAASVELDRLQEVLPDHPSVSFARGRILLENGDVDGALAEFSKVLGVSPDHQGSLYLSAIANSRRGNLSTALGQLNRFVAAQPGYINARLQLAAVLLHTGDPESAERHVQEVLRSSDELNYPAMGLLARALSAQGLHRESVAVYQQVVTARPESVSARLALGSELLLAGEGADGLRELRKAFDMNPASAAAHERLIQAYASLGDMPAAKTQVEAYLEDLPKSPRPSLFLGSFALQERDLPAARKHFERALRLDAGNVIANNGLAILATADSNLEQARQHYLDALAHHGDDIGTLMNLAAVEASRGDFSAMHARLEEAVRSDSKALVPRLALARLKLNEGRPTEAVRQLRALRDDHPREPGLWRLLTEALMAEGEFSAAIDAGERLLTLTPRDVEALATVARLQMRTQRFADAEEHLQRALVLQPDNSNLRKLMADTLLAQGNLEEADKLLAELPKGVASEAAVRVIRGRIALARGKPAEAEAHLRGAMTQAPAEMTVLWLSGAVAAQGRGDEARKLLHDWLLDNPGDVQARLQLASSYLQQGREKEAREHYLKVEEQAPDNVLNLNNLGWLYRLEDPRRALGYIERARRLAPDNPQVRDTYAMIQLERGAVREALAENQRALELLPNNPELLYHRAVILKTAGQVEEAIRILEGLVERADFAQANQARGLLEQLRSS